MILSPLPGADGQVREPAPVAAVHLGRRPHPGRAVPAPAVGHLVAAAGQAALAAARTLVTSTETWPTRAVTTQASSPQAHPRRSPANQVGLYRVLLS